MASVFITGSGVRIGRGLALRFAQDGWDVAVHYNSSAEEAEKTVDEIKDIGRETALVRSDVRDYGEVERSFKQAVDKIGIPNVMVNNAGVFPPPTSLNELDEEQWNDVVNINLRGEFFFSKVFAEYAKENSRIINISSLGAIKIWKQRIPYNVSKAGVVQLTKALARDLAPKISVNSVCPGAIIVEGEPSENDKYLAPEDKIPMKRYGNVNDIYDAVSFFANCSRYITGQVICVDGGFSL